MTTTTDREDPACGPRRLPDEPCVVWQNSICGAVRPLMPGVNSHQSRISIWDAYRLGFRVLASDKYDNDNDAHRLFHAASLPVRLLNSLTPIDYVRYREFEFIFSQLRDAAASPRQILDISSPKLLPLTLAAQFPASCVHSVDVVESEVEFVRRSAQSLNLTNVIPEHGDATRLKYADQQFDVITSVSVFEHIAPEFGGEIPAAAEVGRILAPGGVALLTVPFARDYFAEYKTGTVYERTSATGEPIFFQRFYDRQTLMRNIVEASGLRLAALAFVEERFYSRDPQRRTAHIFNSSPLQNRVFGPWFPLLSRIFLSRPKPLDLCKKPYIACIVLCKSA